MLLLSQECPGSHKNEGFRDYCELDNQVKGWASIFQCGTYSISTCPYSLSQPKEGKSCGFPTVTVPPGTFTSTFSPGLESERQGRGEEEGKERGKLSSTRA